MRRQPCWRSAKSREYIAFDLEQGGISKGYFRTQMEIIRSRWILGRAVANEKIKQLPEIRKQRDPIEWLKKRVTRGVGERVGRF